MCLQDYIFVAQEVQYPSELSPSRYYNVVGKTLDHYTIEVTNHLLDWFGLLISSGYDIFSLSIVRSAWSFDGTGGSPAPNVKASATSLLLADCYVG